MGWANLGEFIKVVASATTAGAACFVAWMAYSGVTGWQIEMLGRRRTELAEDVLSKFYEAKRIISVMRSPFAFGGESEARIAPDAETDAQKRLRDTYYVPISRLNNHSKFFSDLRAKRYSMMALFGPTAEKPFDALDRVLHEISVAASMLMMTAGEEIKDVELHRKHEARIWQEKEDDELATKVNQAIVEMETICGPLLEACA